MNPLFIGPLLDIGKAIFDRFIPDPAKKAEAEMELMRMAANGELQSTLAQLEINAKEAVSPSLWVAGWRPYFGWVGGTAFLYVGLLRPLLGWVSINVGWDMPPDIDTNFLWVVVSGLLGLGAYRSVEKVTGAAK